MPRLCKPSVSVPEYVITMDETLEFAERVHGGKPQLPLALRLIQNTGVRTRHIVQPIEETLRHPGFEERNRIYEVESKKRTPGVIEEALANAGVTSRDIDAIIYVSCTGFLMPSLTAWLINAMGFRSDTRQIPIAQLGCAAGVAAVNRAHDFCVAHPETNVLIVSCELCSLCYQPEDDGVGSLLSDGLFGDAVAAAVVRGSGGTGISLERNASYLIPNTEDWISYAVRDTGFHFQLDRRVPGTMEPLAPVLRELVTGHGWDIGNLDFYIVHAGGPRILDDLSTFLDVDRKVFRHSWATLTEYGNIASAVVLDALRRLFDEDMPMPDATGLVAGFGPGITAEMAVGRWAVDVPEG
jgi:1,3,6,8-tetrahydroxynaphthalene synthase